MLSNNVGGCDDDDDKDENSINIGTVKFYVEQLKLFCASPYARRYSNDMLRFAFTLSVYSSLCYHILMNSKIVILPHPKNLQKAFGSSKFLTWY